jgi:hypothetical protein
LPIDDTHVVVDALFPTKDSLAKASSLDIRITWSQNAQHQSVIHDTLCEDLPKKRWRSVSVPQAESVTQHYFVFNDSKAMMGGSTAFQLQADLDIDVDDFGGCSPEIARDLATCDKKTLAWLIGKVPGCSLRDCGSTAPSMVSHLTNLSPEVWAKTHPYVGKTVIVVCILPTYCFLCIHS